MADSIKNYEPMRGRGEFSENGIQIEEDHCIITENGVSRKVSRKEGAEYVDRIMRGNAIKL